MQRPKKLKEGGGNLDCTTVLFRFDQTKLLLMLQEQISKIQTNKSRVQQYCDACHCKVSLISPCEYLLDIVELEWATG